MCLAIYSPAIGRPTKEALRYGFNNNKDGAGFAYAHDGKLVVQKGYFTFDDFWNAFKIVPDDVPVLIHFRKKTHGPKNAENCHPWIVDENHAMIHNGVIKQCDEKNDKFSDTGKFAQTILKPMFEKDVALWQQPFMKQLLEEFLGTGNKMVILSNSAEVLILRGEYGIWDNDVWYSNDSFRKKTVNTMTDFYTRNTMSRNTSSTTTTKTSGPFCVSDVNIAVVDKRLEELEAARKGNHKFDGKKTQVITGVKAEDIGKPRTDTNPPAGTPPPLPAATMKLNDYAKGLVEKKQQRESLSQGAE